MFKAFYFLQFIDEEVKPAVRFAPPLDIFQQIPGLAYPGKFMQFSIDLNLLPLRVQV